MSDTSRITVRLRPEDTRRLRELMDAGGGSVTDVVREALAHRFAVRMRERRSSRAILRRSGFIGSGEASPTLSHDYKQALAESLSGKHGHR